MSPTAAKRRYSWHYTPDVLRSAARNKNIADNLLNDLGFRVARTLLAR